MSKEALHRAVASMNAEQRMALRVSIVAKRRLRVLYPKSLPIEQAVMDEAYEWALHTVAVLS